MAIIDLSTVQVDDLIPVLTNFKHCNQSILPFTLSGSSEAVFAELLEKAAIGPSAGCVEIGPESNLQAFSEAHALATNLTKGFCKASAHPISEIEPYFDEMSAILSGRAEQNSRMVLSRGASAPSHTERGLFNLVIGKPEDLADFQIMDYDTNEMLSVSDAVSELPGSSSSIYGLIIPGITLQLFSGVEAVTHRVNPDIPAERATNPTVIFQWRLSPDYPIKLGAMLDMVPSFAASGSARSSLDLTNNNNNNNNFGGAPMASQYNLLVRTLTGKTYFVDASPDWNVEQLKSAIEKVDGCPAGDQRLVLAGQNLQTEDGHALQEYGIKDGDKVVLMKNNN
ncbi:hypothetical protein Ndes2526B_g04335 [Nannochloris sp. 'desiccata']|nr:hypothetical protein KSW81_000901 [Chlorella desiccata (nom. nud.)]KAH7620419.1 putative Ubiquitin [Chlorella desiccata (nom. nud.)]